jgi:hypothetical protein
MEYLDSKDFTLSNFVQNFDPNSDYTEIITLNRGENAVDFIEKMKKKSPSPVMDEKLLQEKMLKKLGKKLKKTSITSHPKMHQKRKPKISIKTGKKAKLENDGPTTLTVPKPEKKTSVKKPMMFKFVKQSEDQMTGIAGPIQTNYLPNFESEDVCGRGGMSEPELKPKKPIEIIIELNPNLKQSQVKILSFHKETPLKSTMVVDLCEVPYLIEMLKFCLKIDEK